MAVSAIAQPSYRRRRVRIAALVVLALAAFAAECGVGVRPADAQILNFPTRPSRAKPTGDAQRRASDKSPMLLQATNLKMTM